MCWLEAISQGQSISSITSTIDIYYTIANILGDKIERYGIDGVSLVPLLNGEKNSNPRNELYYYYSEKLIAVSKGKWKQFNHRKPSQQKV
jgi:arylsulfatase